MNWDHKADKFMDKHGGDAIKYGAIGGAVLGGALGFGWAGLGGMILGGILGCGAGAIIGGMICAVGSASIAATPHLIGCAVIGGILLLIAALWGVGAP